ncbi:hypothetical protein ACWC5O_45285 [Streptomyces sp. NPDC001450]|uniref:hypothetical protein n=1 Tax=Streptomyces sp. NPDC005408 TaxID=3155341 RepID=UPI0033A0ACCD
MSRETMVQISVRNASMVELGTRLSEWCDFEIFVPARAFENKVTKKLTKVPLESAIKELGMLIADRQ